MNLDPNTARFKQERLEHLLREKKIRDLSDDELVYLKYLEAWAQRRVIFVCSALATVVAAYLLGVPVMRCIVLGSVAGSVPWLALVYQWR